MFVDYLSPMIPSAVDLATKRAQNAFAAIGS